MGWHLVLAFVAVVVEIGAFATTSSICNSICMKCNIHNKIDGKFDRTDSKNNKNNRTNNGNDRTDSRNNRIEHRIIEQAI